MVNGDTLFAIFYLDVGFIRSIPWIIGLQSSYFVQQVTYLF